MNRSHSLLVVVVVSVVFVGAAAISWLWHRDRELRDQEARVRDEFATNRKVTATLRTATSPVGAAAPAFRKGSQPPETSANPPVASNYTQGSQMNKALREMPEYAPFYRRTLRRRTMREYSEFFALLKLPPERLEAVKVAFDDRIGTLQDVYETAKDHGLGLRESERLMQQYSDESKKRLREILGPDDYEQFERFDKSAAWQRGTLLELEDYFGVRGVPALTAEQKRALINAYSDVPWRSPTDISLPGVQYQKRNVQIATLAAPALDPAQRAGLFAYVDFINSRQQVLAQLFRPLDPDGAVYGSEYQRR